MDTGQVVARFEVERQALALMDHQHIARVLEATQGADSNRVSFATGHRQTGAVASHSPAFGCRGRDDGVQLRTMVTYLASQCGEPVQPANVNSR